MAGACTLTTAFARLAALPQPATWLANPRLSDHNPRSLEHPAHAPGSDYAPLAPSIR